MLRQRLDSIGLSLPPGRRKATELSLLTSLVEDLSLLIIHTYVCTDTCFVFCFHLCVELLVIYRYILYLKCTYLRIPSQH